jgi:TatD DNase family protein
MVFIDVHAHIDMYSEEKIKQIIENAKNNNVKIIINNGLNKKKNKKTLELAKKYEEVKAALGLYPIEALKLTDQEIDEEIKFIKDNKEKIVAIGEVGIDLKWSQELVKQKQIFEKFIDLAISLNKPIIVHSRLAEAAVLDLLEKKKAKKVIIHCFNGKLKLTDIIIKNNWHVSIPANITYVQNFQKLVELIPINLLFCETDSPYLHPTKGKRDNEPKNVMMSYKEIARIKNISLESVQETLLNNYKNLFGI